MDATTREAVKREIKQAYAAQEFTFAYYLELCLKTNEAPAK